MMTTQRNTRHILASEENLREWFRRSAQTQAYRDARQRAEAGPHPTPEMLCDYIAGEMSAADSRIISDHLLFCGFCAQEKLQIHAMRDAIGKELDEIEEEWFGVNENIPVMRFASEMALEMAWQPLAQTASAPQNDHTFQCDDGRIEATCQWKSPKENDPGYVIISWNAEIDSDRKLSIQFINPDTREILYEEPIGNIRNHHASFTFDKLGFDPKFEPWRIAIV